MCKLMSSVFLNVAFISHSLNNNNLWTVATKSLLEESGGDLSNLSSQMQDLNKIFVFVGDKKSGKTNLIMKLLEI